MESPGDHTDVEPPEVMVHELCHLEHRDHSPAFWALVQRVLPDHEERKRWLEEHEVEVG